MRPINSEILRLAWPAIATNVTTPLLSLADIAIVGHLGSVAAIGAVAVGGTMLSILYFMFAFLRMGTSGLTAQAFGACQNRRMRQVFLRGLGVALVGGGLLVLLSEGLGGLVLRFMDADDAVQPLARIYFGTAILGAPAALTTNVVSGWLLGIQRSKPIMWIALTTNLLNIILSLLFVYGFEMGIRGVALGTVIAQWIGATVGLLVVRKYFPGKSGDSGSGRGEWLSFFRLNFDIFLRTVCLSAVTLWFTHAGAQLGAAVLAVNSLLLQLFLVFSYFMDGFAFAGEALAGKFYGAGDRRSLQQCIDALLRWGVVLAFLCSVLYFIGAESFLSLLTDRSEVLDLASSYVLWAVLVPLTGFAAFIWDGIFIGLTRSRWMLLSMSSAMVVYFVLFFSLRPALGNHALWLSFVVYLAVRGLVSHCLYNSTKKKSHENE